MRLEHHGRVDRETDRGDKRQRQEKQVREFPRPNAKADRDKEEDHEQAEANLHDQRVIAHEKLCLSFGPCRQRRLRRKRRREVTFSSYKDSSAMPARGCQ